MSDCGTGPTSVDPCILSLMKYTVNGIRNRKTCSQNPVSCCFRCIFIAPPPPHFLRSSCKSTVGIIYVRTARRPLMRREATFCWPMKSASKFPTVVIFSNFFWFLFSFS
jgi:hypothetical protein